MSYKNTAYLFPGQGSQYKGMGLNLYNKYKVFKRTYEQASDVLNFDLKKISFSLESNDINQTFYTQPIIFTYNVAIFRLLRELNYYPTAVAGHSLGEYSALVSINCISFEDGLKIIKTRSQEMDNCASNRPGKMAAIINLNFEETNKLLKNFKETVVIANINSNKQIIISGDLIGIDKIINHCKKNKIRGIIPLNVSGAFHSPLMENAKIALEKIINNTKFNDVKIPIYQNYNARSNLLGKSIKKNLINQLDSPVLWLDSINNMINDNNNNFIEVGPGNVLKNLNKNINSGIKNINFKELLK